MDDLFTMRTQIPLSSVARGHFAGTRASATPLREEAELILARGGEVVFDFSGIEVTQSFVDELVGAAILRHGPDILDRIVFRACSDDVRAIVEFVAADRCDQYLKAHTH
jgi:hypothetical protein